MNLVFDFGGVLFNWHPPTLLARVWPHRVADEAQGREVAAQFFQNYVGDWGAFDQGLIGLDEVVRRIATRTGWSETEIRQVTDAVPAELAPQPGTVAMVEELKRAGHRLFYLSNMPEPYADFLEQSYPLHDWFEDGVFSGRVKHIKPGRTIFEIAAQRFGVPHQSLIFLDDHPQNVEGAKALGWQALLFRNAEQARTELEALMR
jgi:putative hydrolase of the HAD superfamily